MGIKFIIFYPYSNIFDEIKLDGVYDKPQIQIRKIVEEDFVIVQWILRLRQA